MKITGHRSWRSFQRYVNITEQAVAREFARVYAMPASGQRAAEHITPFHEMP